MRRVIDKLLTAARRLGRRSDRRTDRLTVIGLIGGERDRRILEGVCARHHWSVVFADNCEAARRALDRIEAPTWPRDATTWAWLRSWS